MALPPPRVPLNLDLRLAVLDLREALEQLERLSVMPDEAGKDEMRERKEVDVLRLQRSVVMQAESMDDRVDGQVFVDALARLRVRLRLYEQLACIKEEPE